MVDMESGAGDPLIWSALGALEDAMPDRWGHNTILTIDRPSRLTPLDLLYYAGDPRFGALGISANSDSYRPCSTELLPTRSSLNEARDLIQRIIEKLPIDARERLILASSKTMGGARPKMLVDLSPWPQA